MSLIDSLELEEAPEQENWPCACDNCDWKGHVDDCEWYTDQEGWEYPEYKVPICPKCKEDIYL